MSARRLPTGIPGGHEPPCVLRCVKVYHPRGTVTVEIRREVAEGPGGGLDVSGHDLNVVGTLANDRGVSIEFRDPRTLTELRDVLDAAIAQAERDGLLDAPDPVPALDPGPPALTLTRTGRPRPRRMRYRPDARPDGGAA